LAILSHKLFLVRDSELSYIILIQKTTNPPTTTPIPSDYPDILPQYQLIPQLPRSEGVLIRNKGYIKNQLTTDI